METIRIELGPEAHLVVNPSKETLLAHPTVAEHIEAEVAERTKMLTKQVEDLQKQIAAEYQRTHAIPASGVVVDGMTHDHSAGFTCTLILSDAFVKQLMATGQSHTGDSREAIERLVENVCVELAKQGVAGGPSFETLPYKEPPQPEWTKAKAY